MAMYDEESITGLATALVVMRKLDKDISEVVDTTGDVDDAFKMLTDK
jgi:hypothetical protein